MTAGERTAEAWPPLPLDEWRETQETLHLWTQVVGKVKLALTPLLNEWWNVALTVTPRGLTTGAIPAGDGSLAIDFDFVDHALYIRANDVRTHLIPLVPKPVASFHSEFTEALRAMGIAVTITPLPTTRVRVPAYRPRSLPRMSGIP